MPANTPDPHRSTARPTAMLISGQLMLHDAEAPGAMRLAPGWVRTDGAGIAATGEGSPPGMPDLGGEGCVITPGFVDAHLHIPQFDSIGADGLGLLAWLERVIFPAEARWADPDFAGHMAARVARTLLDHGTTAIAAYGTVHQAGSASAMRALADAGLAGHFGQVLMDRDTHSPAELCRPARRLIAEAAAAEPIGRLRPAVTPRFAVSCTAELLHAAGELAARTGRFVQTHLAETTDECATVAGLFDGRSYTDVYSRAGLLTERSLLGHGIHLDESDRASLARAGSTIAHCPTANLFLQAGAMDLAAHLRAGVRVCLGSDVAGGPDIAMPRVARAMIETVKALRLRGLSDRRLPSAASAWWQITRGNALALGLNRCGSLRPGSDADIVILEPGSDAWRRTPDPLSALLYGFSERWIRGTVVHGRLHKPPA